MGVNLPVWVQTTLTISAVLIAAHTIWNKAIIPAARIINLVEDTLPLITELADKFRPNSGNSLYDKITQMSNDIVVLNKRVSENTKNIDEVIVDDETSVIVSTDTSEIGEGETDVT